MEHRFPQVQRIADLYWPLHRLVIEVQCSPLSICDLQQRTEDYRSMELFVVWLLHTRSFRNWHHPMQTCAIPHYFTNLDTLGHGMIYDRRHGYDAHTFPIKLHQVMTAPYPSPIMHRAQWPLHWKGDLIDHALKKEEPIPPSPIQWKKKIYCWIEKWIDHKLRQHRRR